MKQQIYNLYIHGFNADDIARLTGIKKSDVEMYIQTHITWLNEEKEKKWNELKKIFDSPKQKHFSL